MSINYDFYQTTGKLADENAMHVRPVSNQTIDTQALAERIQRSSTATVGDVKLVLDALSVAVKQELLNGNKVHIDGLGYFSVSMKGTVRQGKAGKLKLKEASVRSILFKPEKQYVQQFAEAKFTPLPARGARPAAPDDTSLSQVLEILAREWGSFTTKEFCRATGWSPTTAYRRLKELEAAGMVANHGTRSTSLWHLCK
ncbi:MAG: HU family DNA-binding protein [Bacteroidaceae bacterium]|nr:HU family DNA-binding protein [Bacteroidaceae bacterium]